MRRLIPASGLFSRILLWLLMTISLIAAVLTGLAHHLGAQMYRERRQMALEMMLNQGRTLVEMVEQADDEGRPCRETIPVRIWLLNKNGEILVQPRGSTSHEPGAPAIEASQDTTQRTIQRVTSDAPDPVAEQRFSQTTTQGTLQPSIQSSRSGYCQISGDIPGCYTDRHVGTASAQLLDYTLSSGAKQATSFGRQSIPDAEAQNEKNIGDNQSGYRHSKMAHFYHARRQELRDIQCCVASLTPEITAITASFTALATPHGSLFCARINGASGEPYFVVSAEKERPPPLRIMSRVELDSVTIAWILAIISVLTLSSLWLAGHLARPILACQKVSRSIAEGNLQARLPATAITRKDELGGLAADINAMAQRIDAMFTTQQRLLQDISHELRTPLARLQVALELLRHAQGDEHTLLVQKMGANVERLNDLIQQILDFSRLERLQGSSWEKKPFDLVPFSRNLLADLEFELQQSNRRLHASIPDLPLYCVGSQEFLRRAVENPLRNAVKHTPAETEIFFYLTRITQNDKEWAEFKIHDHGPGVTPELLSQLFDAFIRGPQADKITTPGLGLGLAITRRTVEAHHGFVEAKSPAAGGLTIRICLPITPSLQTTA